MLEAKAAGYHCLADLWANCDAAGGLVLYVGLLRRISIIWVKDILTHHNIGINLVVFLVRPIYACARAT